MTIEQEYTGVLAEPIDDEALRRLPEDEQTERFQAQMDERLEALLDHFSIARGPDQWRHVVHALALAHVPGFDLKSFQSKPGRPRTDVADDASLYMAVLRKADDTGLRIADVCRILARTDPKGRSSDTLRRRYYGIKKSRNTLVLAFYASPWPTK